MHQGQPPKTSIWLTTAEAGEMLFLSPSRVGGLVLAGELEGKKVRNRVLVTRISVILYGERSSKNGERQ